MTAARLVQRLEQFRRRDAGIRALGIAMHAACVATAGAVIAASWLDPLVAVVLSAGIAATTTVIGSIVTRAPLGRVAAAIDRHGALSDRVATAFEHRHDAGPVAGLLVQDAARHADAVAPADVFPLRLPARIAWTAAASALAIVVVSALPADRRSDDGGGTAASQDGAAGASGQRSNEGGRSGGRGTTPATKGGTTAPSTPAAGQRAPAASATAAPRSAQPPDAPARGTGATARTAQAPVTGESAAAADAKLRARAAGSGASGTMATGGGAVSAGRGEMSPNTTHAAGAARGRDVNLNSSNAAGRRVLAPGLRAYVRSYFDAINK